MSKLTSILKLVGHGEYGTPVSLSTSYADCEVPTNVSPRTVAVGGAQKALFAAALDSIILNLDNVVTGTKASVFVTADAAGDVLLTPVSVERDIAFGQTVTDSGSVMFDGGDVSMACVADLGDLTLDDNGNVVVYLWAALDGGTADLLSASIVTRP